MVNDKGVIPVPGKSRLVVMRINGLLYSPASQDSQETPLANKDPPIDCDKPNKEETYQKNRDS